MYSYALLYFFILLLLTLRKTKLKENVLIISAFGVMTLFSGLRYNVGKDYTSYEKIIHDVINSNILVTDPGFGLTIKVADLANLPTSTTFLVSSFIISLGIYIYISNFSKNRYLSTFIYFSFPVFYLASTNGIRQFIAVSIFLASIRSLTERRPLQYLALIFLATLFHRSALLLLPLYYVLLKPINIRNCLIGFIIFFLSLSAAQQILTSIGISPKYFNDSWQSGTLDPKSFALSAVFLIMVLSAPKAWRAQQKNQPLLFMIYISALISLAPLISNIPVDMAARLSSYFTPALICLLPNYIYAVSASPIRLGLSISVCIVGTLYYFTTIILMGEQYNLVPYSTIIGRTH